LRVGLEVGVAVQPRHHGRVLRDLDQEVPEVAQGVLAKQLILSAQPVCIFRRLRTQRPTRSVWTYLPRDLAETGGEVVVPEQGHLLLQRPLGVHHPEQHPLPSVEDPFIRPKGASCRGPEESRHADGVVDGIGDALVVDQRVDKSRHAHLLELLPLRGRVAESGSTNQMGDCGINSHGSGTKGTEGREVQGVRRIRSSHQV